MKTSNGKGKTVLITGGGGGIGRELCNCFFKDGYNLFVVSLLQAELDLLETDLSASTNEGQFVKTLQADLSLPNAAEEVYAYTQAHGLDVHALVNNAGFGAYGEHVDLPLEKVKSLVTLNGQTLVLMCSLFGKEMKARGEGYILNVGSTISFQPLPHFAIYSGTKAMVVAFSEALSRELEPYGVVVSCLCPGTTATQFLDTAGLQNNNGKKVGIGFFAHGIAMDAKMVAEVGYKGLFNRKTRSIPGVSNHLHFLLTRVVPNRVITFVVQKFFTLAPK